LKSLPAGRQVDNQRAKINFLELSIFSLDIAKKWVYKWSTNVDYIEAPKGGYRPDSERTVEAATVPTLEILWKTNVKTLGYRENPTKFHRKSLASPFVPRIGVFFFKMRYGQDLYYPLSRQDLLGNRLNDMLIV
jgi:hypothetical protein